MDKRYKFLKTTFSDEAQKLIDMGFVLVSHEGNVWTFINKSTTIQFNEKKVVPTNILYT